MQWNLEFADPLLEDKFKHWFNTLQTATGERWLTVAVCGQRARQTQRATSRGALHVVPSVIRPAVCGQACCPTAAGAASCD